MMGRQGGDQNQLFYLFNLERRIPACHLLRRINPVVTRAVEADHFAVEHLIFDDMARQCGVLGRISETRRKRRLFAQRLARGFGQPGHHRRVEDSRGDAGDADLMLGELARRGQDQGGDAALRCAA